MSKFLSVLFLFTLSLSAQSITVSKDKWILVGSLYDVLVENLDLHVDDVVWKYDGSWKYYKKNIDSVSYDKLDSIKSGEGFWIKSSDDYTFEIPEATKSEVALKSGWNLIGPSVSDINLTNDTKYKDAAYAWIYDNSIWRYWIKDGQKQFDTIHIGSGAWVYNNAPAVDIGSIKTPLINGEFSTVSHLATSDVEDIWNISFKVSLENITSFNIGIKFIKSNGAYGEFMYYGLSLQNGVLSAPSKLYVKGQKSDGTSATQRFDSTYDPNNLRQDSILLEGDILTLKLGTIMKNQTQAPASTFQAVSDYNITVVPENLEIDSGSSKTLQDLVGFINTFNGIGISGDIEIR